MFKSSSRLLLALGLFQAVLSTPITSSSELAVIPNGTVTSPLASTTWNLELCGNFNCASPCTNIAITTAAATNICNIFPYASLRVSQVNFLPFPFKLALGSSCPSTLFWPPSDLGVCLNFSPEGELWVLS
ncbi:hypothetical protein SISNIDRAFT_487633 [Sistotremastrum niveocremeum HHB9708]|uniref:Uncharacterized protein n=1 Tax=Sistotremastrum niveocremeum HHB9708 TaxID=1314777 RepID=A0A164SBB8_9AGAM|nr:hypothetical protein SISNIDRAFT_487633 [Sistotremastrum niveocremeum HHB9708]